MIKNVLTHIGGIENYGIFSLCLFVAVFTGMLVWACCLKRARLEADARLPLDTDNNQPGNAHE